MALSVPPQSVLFGEDGEEDVRRPDDLVGVALGRTVRASLSASSMTRLARGVMPTSSPGGGPSWVAASRTAERRLVDVHAGCAEPPIQAHVLERDDAQEEVLDAEVPVSSSVSHARRAT